MKDHFESFGTVTKIMVNAEKGVASVEFTNHNQAMQAKRLGSSLQDGTMQITWKRFPSRSDSNGAYSSAMIMIAEL